MAILTAIPLWLIGVGGPKPGFDAVRSTVSYFGIEPPMWLTPNMVQPWALPAFKLTAVALLIWALREWVSRPVDWIGGWLHQRNGGRAVLLALGAVLVVMGLYMMWEGVHFPRQIQVTRPDMVPGARGQPVPQAVDAPPKKKTWQKIMPLGSKSVEPRPAAVVAMPTPISAPVAPDYAAQAIREADLLRLKADEYRDWASKAPHGPIPIGAGSSRAERERVIGAYRDYQQLIMNVYDGEPPFMEGAEKTLRDAEAQGGREVEAMPSDQRPAGIDILEFRRAYVEETRQRWFVGLINGQADTAQQKMREARERALRNTPPPPPPGTPGT